MKERLKGESEKERRNKRERGNERTASIENKIEASKEKKS